MTVAQPVALRSTIPGRLDRLKWSPFHTRMVAGGPWRRVDPVDGLQIRGQVPGDRQQTRDGRDGRPAAGSRKVDQPGPEKTLGGARV